jgi:hypothetical protein
VQKNSAWFSYALKPVEADHPQQIGFFGGHPRGIRAHQWPRCAVCGAPMCHMAQLDAGPWLDLQGFARITVFICHATGGRCEDWDPWKGSNRVVLQRIRDDNLYDGPPTVRVYRRRMLGVEEPIDELALMIQVKEQGLPMAKALETLRLDKLGGGAVWLHGDATPQNPDGNGPMKLILQMTTNIVSFDITKSGMGYVFVDPHDTSEHAAKFLWQGS